jgi:hypothetical protein
MPIVGSVFTVQWAGPIMFAALNSSPPAPTPDPIVQIVMTPVNSGFPQATYFAPQAAKNQMLAVALAAISTQSNVQAYVDQPPAPAGTHLQCYSLQIAGT